MGKGSIVDLVEILVFAREQREWGHIIFCTVSLDNRNLTLLLSFGTSWDLLDEMLDSWIYFLDDLVLGGLL